MKNYLRTYVFDIDRNLFNTRTTIFMEKARDDGQWEKVEISQDEYMNTLRNCPEKVRYLDNDIEKSMVFFSDREDIIGRFKADIFDALVTGKHGPSFGKFKEAVKFANPIGIITARGHKESTLIETFSELIYGILVEDKSAFCEKMKKILDDTVAFEHAFERYMNFNKFYPVNCDSFSELYAGKATKLKKILAMDDFLQHINCGLKRIYNSDCVSVGFSDDNLDNVKQMIDFFQQKSREKEYEKFHFVVYYTGQNSMKKIRVTDKNL